MTIRSKDDGPSAPKERNPNAGAPSFTPTTPPAIGLPKAGGAIRGIGEKFATNAVTGTGSMSVPIAVSPGRAGFGPALTLTYDSGAGNGPFGFGWQLGLPMITRKTAKGLPRYADAAESDTFILSDAEDLVPLLDHTNGWQRAAAIEPDYAPGYRVDRYRPRTEGLFARIERWTRTVDGDVHWRSISRDNITTCYGADDNSRIFEPGMPGRIFSWLISQSRDDKGNTIVYTYTAENGDGVDTAQAHERHRTEQDRTTNRYLKRIQYGNRVSHLVDPNPVDPKWMFEFVFDYGDHDPAHPAPEVDGQWLCRTDPFSSYRPGFEVRTYRLCRRVLMFHHFPGETGVGADCLVRSTDFDYRPGDAVGTFLAGVTQRGYRREGNAYVDASMPPVEFSYSTAQLNGEIAEIDSASLANLPAGLAAAGHEWVDLDGEGISGILVEQVGAWYFKPNEGGGRFGALRTVPTLPSGDGKRQLLDLAGDGQLDVVAFDGAVQGFYERTRDGDWSPLRSFTSLPVLNWADPNLRFVDLNGDGHADVLITEHDALTWYPSLAEEGYGPAAKVVTPHDERSGPRVVFSDGAQSIHLADLSGDGLTDLVRIRNGEVCYWPNLGHGRFGAKVTMDNAPWFDHEELFDQRYVLLADVDGSGVTDIVYLGARAAAVYLNRSGNSWSEPHLLPALSGMDNRTAVTAVDLFGTGTACLVWSSDRPGDERCSLRYVDLMARVKPHLLVGVDNNLGSRTEVHYASSTEFYLADKESGRPWLTRLPFPVQVVERVETNDRIGGNRFVTRYAYHHGFFDGLEREFRGFGMVEQWDTEEFAALSESDSPPVLTKTWFHTGAGTDLAGISTGFAAEYHREPGLTDAQQTATLLDDTLLPTEIRLPLGPAQPYVLSAAEEREACRALRGSVLRQEVYALDGSAAEDRPYHVAEGNQTIELLQPRAGNRHAVFFTHPRETVSRHYERRLYAVEGSVELRADPRVAHELTLDVDAWGNVLRSVSIGYGRRFPDADVDPRLPAALLAEIGAQQTRLYATVSVNTFTEAIDAGQSYRAPQPHEAKLYQLGNVLPTADQFGSDELRDLLDAPEIPYENTWADGIPATEPYRRLLDHVRMIYRADDLSGPLPPGVAQSRALPHESYQLACTPGLLNQVYEQDVIAVLEDEGGYVAFSDGWWIPSGTVSYSVNDTDSPEEELAAAMAHFFLPRRFTDPFGKATRVTYDEHDLAVMETQDSLDNVVSASTDYRVLAPRELTDPNGNRSAVLFDALGLVVATAVMGKSGEQQGDSLDGLDPDPPPDLVQARLADPLADPHPMLGPASTRLLYDLFAYVRTKTDPQPQPAVAYTCARETHVADLDPGDHSRLRHTFSYSDGFGRVIQAKAIAEPGQDAGQRWVGSGWTILDNKGNPVRQYEPFFSSSHRFEFANQVGVSPVLCYDPVERVVATLTPEGSYAKVVFDPWHQSTWDSHDTVLLDPRGDEDVQGFLAPYLATMPGWQTWWQRRAGGAMGPAEQAAAAKAQAHADTPTVMYADSLGRGIVTVADNGSDVLYPTRVVLDIEGLQREVIDARGISVLCQDFDVTGRVLHTHSPDAGDRWVLPDIAGRPIRRWDSRGHEFRQSYDALRRPTELWSGDTLIELAVYGEGHPEAEARNLRGQLHRSYDGAGLSEVERHDFKGNPVVTTRRLAAAHQDRPHWSDDPDALLENESFATKTTFDALNRPVSSILPDGTEILPSYNEAGLLETVHARLRGAGSATTFVADIDYDAKGQRELIAYGNGVVTSYTYDPFTFRLRRLETLRDNENLQDLAYFYDPVGNITEIADTAQQTVFFADQVVTPTAAYVYDAVYRLISATGREHASIGSQPDHAGPVTYPVPHPNDSHALRVYVETYNYDPVGNILALAHHAGSSGSWTRRYSYSTTSNRLLAHSLPSDLPDAFSATFSYDEHGNMTSMPHLPTMTWDMEDQLSIVDLGGGGTAYYTYDAAGQRVRKVIERLGGLTEERIYLGGFELYRKRSAGSVTFERETVHLTDGASRIALVETTTVDPSDPNSVLQPRQRYQLSNHLGSASLELDDSALVISYEEYHPYGTTSLLLATGAAEVSAKRYRYTGKEQDDETAFYYHGARYYAPWLARWTAADPAGLADGVNAYVYTKGNPVIFTDPTGTLSASEEAARRAANRLPGSLGPDQIADVYKKPPDDLIAPETAEFHQATRNALDRGAALRAYAKEKAAKSPAPTKAEKREVDKAAARNWLLDHIGAPPWMIVMPGMLPAVGLQYATQSFRAPEPEKYPSNFREYELRRSYDFTQTTLTVAEMGASLVIGPIIEATLTLRIAPTAELTSLSALHRRGVWIKGQETKVASPRETARFNVSLNKGKEIAFLEYSDRAPSVHLGSQTKVKVPFQPSITSTQHTHPQSGVAIFSQGDYAAFKKRPFDSSVEHSVLGWKYPETNRVLEALGQPIDRTVVKTTIRQEKLMQADSVTKYRF